MYYKYIKKYHYKQIKAINLIFIINNIRLYMEKLATNQDLRNIDSKYLVLIDNLNKYPTYDTVTSAKGVSGSLLFRVTVTSGDKNSQYKDNQLVRLNDISKYSSGPTPTPRTGTLSIIAVKGSTIGYRVQIYYTLYVNGTIYEQEILTSEMGERTYTLNLGDTYNIQVNSAMWQDSFSTPSQSTTNYFPKSWSGTIDEYGYTFHCTVNK